jgi:hypothetical protein
LLRQPRRGPGAARPTQSPRLPPGFVSSSHLVMPRALSVASFRHRAPRCRAPRRGGFVSSSRLAPPLGGFVSSCHPAPPRAGPGPGRPPAASQRVIRGPGARRPVIPDHRAGRLDRPGAAADSGPSSGPLSRRAAGAGRDQGPPKPGRSGIGAGREVPFGLVPRDRVGSDRGGVSLRKRLSEPMVPDMGGEMSRPSGMLRFVLACTEPKQLRISLPTRPRRVRAAGPVFHPPD